VTAVPAPLARLVDRFVQGTVLGLAGWWLLACWCVRGSGVPDWLLPACLAAGLVVRPPASGAPPAPWRHALPIAAVLALVAGVLVHGALATPSRHWDGAAAFDPKAYWLTVAPTLQQPFFADRAVFHHSPDYPLLQQLLIASVERLTGVGRAVLPALWVLLLGVLACAWRRAAVPAWLRLAGVLAVGLVPQLLGPGGGAVDSGYGELATTLATTLVAAGLLQRDSLWLAAGVVLAVGAKPEGTVYAAIAVLAALLAGEQRAFKVGLVALGGAAVVWQLARAQLLGAAASGPRFRIMKIVAITMVCGLLLGLLARGRRRPVVWRALGVLVLAIVAGVVLLGAARRGDAVDGVFGTYLDRLPAAWSRLGNLGAWLGTGLDHAIVRLHFGATFVLPFVVAWWSRRERRRGAAPATPPEGRAALTFVVLGLACTAVPFVLSPEADLAHHLRSSLPRLLLHWLGPVWLLTIARAGALTTGPTSMSPTGTGAPRAAA
jgi:hypothetical protein